VNDDEAADDGNAESEVPDAVMDVVEMKTGVVGPIWNDDAGAVDDENWG